MTPRRGPVFVQRRTYRRRRTADGARMLPILGAILFAIPLLWRGGGEAGQPAADLAATARTAWVMGYLFVVWLGLVVLSGVVSRFLRPEDDDPDDDPDAAAGGHGGR